jgi:DNA replication protein
MKGFVGFPAGKQPYTPIPDLFFGEILPDIEDLAELKVTLHIFWLIAKNKGERPYVSDRELAADALLRKGLRSPVVTAEEALKDALQHAVARGTLLCVSSHDLGEERNWYFLNSEKGRQSVDELLAGKWTPAEPGRRMYLETQRPNIFVLYEQNIGPLTPMMAEELQDAEQTYPAEWIEDAFREAVKSNVRKWRYILSILERWKGEGRDDETSRRPDERDRRRFIEGEYADFIEH